MGDCKKEKSLEISTIHLPSVDIRKDSVKDPFCHIDKDLIRFKVQFTLFFGANGTILPYVPLIARSRIGLSATSLSIILTTQLFISIFIKPMLGFLTDYFNKPKIILTSLIVIQSISYFLLLPIPSIQQPTESIENLTLLNRFEDFNSTIKPINLRVNIDSSCKKEVSETPCSLNSTDGCYIDFSCEGTCNRHNQTDGIETPDDINNMSIIQKILRCCSPASEFKSNIIMIHENLTESNFMRLFPEKTEIFNDNETLPCSSIVIRSKSSGSLENRNVNDLETPEFWMYAILMTTIMTAYSSVTTLGDTICLEGVQKFKGDFGRQRMFGAISWGVLAAIGGYLIDVTDNFLTTCILMAGLQCITVWNIFKIDVVKPQFSKNFLTDIWSLLSSAEFLIIELAMIMNGIGYGIVFNYLLWYLDSLGASKLLCGMVHYVQCFGGEIPFMFISGWLIKKLGYFNLLSLSLLSYGIRFMGYCYLQDPWFVLLLEVTHGFTYGAFYPAVAFFGKLSAKPGSEATTQSILFSTHEGLGAGIGCVLAGIGFDHLGGQQTFFYLSIFSFCATLLNVLNMFLIQRRTKEFRITARSFQ